MQPDTVPTGATPHSSGPYSIQELEDLAQMEGWVKLADAFHDVDFRGEAAVLYWFSGWLVLAIGGGFATDGRYTIEWSGSLAGVRQRLTREGQTWPAAQELLLDARRMALLRGLCL